MSYRPEDLPDPRNATIQVHVGGRLVPRDEARVSVFDSSVQGGDAVWEGLRVYDGRVFKLDEHLERLVASAKAMAFARIPSKDEVRAALFETLAANGMRDGAHARLTLTRGEKVTSGMSPRFNKAGPCLIVLAEWKQPVYDAAGIRLITSSWRRNSPQCVDSKIHHNNLINNILAKVEADVAGVDDALMLDLEGFLSETNATNVFLVRKGALLTPEATSCLPGITRATVIELAREHGVALEVRRISLSEVYAADEMFTTGTMGELSPVLEADGRTIGDGAIGPLTRRIQRLYTELTAREGVALPF
jgi:branched-chain amino acid aminotransferase group I